MSKVTHPVKGEAEIEAQASRFQSLKLHQEEANKGLTKYSCGKGVREESSCLRGAALINGPDVATDCKGGVPCRFISI